ncbi:MAG: hypothetical protein ACREO0_05510 [Pseudoxanthomonas sp.]
MSGWDGDQESPDAPGVAAAALIVVVLLLVICAGLVLYRFDVQQTPELPAVGASEQAMQVVP